jgi:hypothetical protein
MRAAHLSHWTTTHDIEAARFQLIADQGQFDLIVVHDQNAERSVSRQRLHTSRGDAAVNGVGFG